MTAFPVSSRAETTNSAQRGDTAARARVWMLTAFRIVTAAMFVTHGLRGLLGWFGGVDHHGGVYGLSNGLSFWASVIQAVAGGLVLLGLFARPAAVLCSGSMAFAYFTMHQPGGLVPLQNGGEPAALYAWLFLLIAVLGPGAFTLAGLLRRTRADAPDQG